MIASRSCSRSSSATEVTANRSEKDDQVILIAAKRAFGCVSVMPTPGNRCRIRCANIAPWTNAAPRSEFDAWTLPPERRYFFLSHWSTALSPDIPDDHHSGASTPTPAGAESSDWQTCSTASSAQPAQKVRVEPSWLRMATPKFPWPPGSAPIHVLLRELTAETLSLPHRPDD